ncbi:type III secretion system outer membrane ring subunit SctC [[Erwinia] mediterraneensis]|uniref:type III secretion system outer membrane ring subunit SctC n=1 Tax=[Erwinia] mediterraneensis TaxID=2161819 RepID=UPI001030192C|nr:type III secretion system outer membrane ring subunit SctC [[Erwinia] mediterraneensis]
MKKRLNKFTTAQLFVAVLIFSLPQINAFAENASVSPAGYVARNESIKGVFDALSSQIGKPVLLSKTALRKKVSGDFDFSEPQLLLEKLSEQLGLIWYHDGQAIYIYDASEMRNAVIVLHNIPFSVLNNYLIKSKLYDKRYALHADNGSGTIYFSGPPVYIDLVTNIARYLDEKKTFINSVETKVTMIPLSNTFVEDRQYSYRGETIRIPGVANIIRDLLSSSDMPVEVISTRDLKTAGAGEKTLPAAMPDFNASQAAPPVRLPDTPLSHALANRPGVSTLRIIANPGNNSLLVKGSAEQVEYVQTLVSSLDVQKRHIELSVWIVDLQKDALNQMGVEWKGNINMGSQLGVSLNGGASSTVDGASFMAAVLALHQKNRANIVARPMILTQENIPAIFDNSRTFYTKLIGERSVELQHVTYGTSVNVLPRFTDSDEIEMMLTVEDGSTLSDNKVLVKELPEVGRTNISTIARVPRGKSLLIGGYTRNESAGREAKIPLLGDIPWVGKLFRYQKTNESNMVRVFLIQPREIVEPLKPDASELVKTMKTRLSDEGLQDWMQNYLDSRKWR